MKKINVLFTILLGVCFISCGSAPKEEVEAVPEAPVIEETAVEESEKVPYMPEEKAKDLMEKNPDVRAFVADLGLDTK